MKTPVLSCIDNMRIGGTELNAFRVASSLDRTRFVPIVLCIGSTADGAVRELYRAANIEMVHIPIGGFGTAQHVAAGLAFRRLIREREINIVHAHDLYSNVFATLWAVASGAKLVIASRRWWSDLPSSGYAMANRAAFRMADVVLANSVTVGESLVARGDAPESKVVVIPNFVDDSLFHAADEQWRRRQLTELDLEEGNLVLGCVARLSSVKNHALLIRSVRRVRDIFGARLSLLLVGDGPERGALIHLVGELGLDRYVRFVGERPPLPSWHSLFDISILTSDSEGFPNSLVEAMACGRCVIATDVGGVRDAVSEVNGLLVPARDELALASALAQLCQDSARRTQMGLAGRERAASEFSKEAVMTRVHALYGRI